MSTNALKQAIANLLKDKKLKKYYTTCPAAHPEDQAH
tara:strand:+ start:1134 stop:1244 length:111 start_codon:yes stop_codon:yes gene_type:complete